MAYKYIKIIQVADEIYKVWNVVYKQYVGEIRKERFGRFMHWQSFQYLGFGYTNGCMKEISKFITSLYSGKLR